MEIQSSTIQVSPNDIISRAIGFFESSQYIDLIKLAKSYGVDVYARSENDFNASIEFSIDPEHFSIYVNPDHAETRRRFSIAHELAHYILHSDEVKKNLLVDRDNIHSLSPEKEAEANELAAKILMPEELVHKYIENNDLDGNRILSENSVRKIASFFTVSLMVAILRLKGIGYELPYIAFS